MLWSLKCCSVDIILPNPRERTITAAAIKEKGENSTMTGFGI
jgi:hypothetical protein